MNKREKLYDIIKKIEDLPKHYFARSLFVDRNELLVLCNNIIDNDVKNIIEIGTYKGVTSAIFASIIDGDLHTINVNAEEIKLAKKMWDDLGITNIHQIHGSSLDKLPNLVNEIDDVNFIYVDGMHSIPYPRKEFEIIKESKIKDGNSLIYFDDGGIDGVLEAINKFDLNRLENEDWIKADLENKGHATQLRAYTTFGDFKADWTLKELFKITKDEYKEKYGK